MEGGKGLDGPKTSDLTGSWENDSLEDLPACCTKARAAGPSSKLWFLGGSQNLGRAPVSSYRISCQESLYFL